MKAMLCKILPLGRLQSNCVILGDSATGQAVVVDPGDAADHILRTLAALKLRASAIVHTHGHLDHMGATADLARSTGAPTYLNRNDLFLHEMMEQQARYIGLHTPPAGRIDHDLDETTVLPLGAYEIKVLPTPGHSPGSVCLWVPSQNLCLTGDTLFAGGIGRTDFWGGDAAAIVDSIKRQLFTLPGATVVIPGHGPQTSIEVERRTNPFVGADSTPL